MAGMESKLSVMREMRRKHLSQLRVNHSTPSKDKYGSASNSLAGTVRFLAVADYVLDKDIAAFCSGISEAAAIRGALFDRFDSGGEVSPSYVSMMSYKALLSALAAGNVPLAKSLAEKMGGRTVLEKEYDRPFDIAFGYALKNMVLSDLVSAAQWVDALEIACRDAENADFAGYAKVLRAILNESQAEAHAGLIDIVAGHKRQSSGKGLFKDTEDELLCVWAVAVANLARMRGMQVYPVEPLIPTDLLI